jgi:quinol monooxygenase YgiN
MSLHFLVAIAGSLGAAAGTGMLAARCLRVSNAALVSWTVAIVGLTIALGAQALGYGVGFGSLSFRAMELGAQLIAPLALGLGLAELAGKSITARFAARLQLTALAVIAFVVLGSDPLSSATFSKTWPAPAVYYQIVPNKLIEYLLAPATLIVALIAIGVTVTRSGRDPAWQDAGPAAAAAAAAALMLAVPGVAALLKFSLPLASLFTLLSILATAATWFAGMRVSRLRLQLLRQDAGSAADSDWAPRRSWGRDPDAAGNFGPAADDEFGIYRGNGTQRQLGDDLAYRGPAGYGEQEAGHDGFGDQALYRDGTGYPQQPLYRDEAGYPGDGRYPDEPWHPGDPAYPRETGYPQDDPYPGDAGYPRAEYPRDERYSAQPAGYPQEAGFRQAPGQGAPGREPPPLFGQIAIYTLLEDRVDDFDRLTQQMVTEVRAQEPDTLVYIVHAVPSAPMQRILYEVYRDRGAYEAHKRRPYVIAFEADRRPFVLATNIIELGLQQAKVSPLPSLSTLLSDTGFDLLSDTGFGQPGYGPRRPAASPPGSTG